MAITNTSQSPWQAIVLDLGDVLFEWSTGPTPEAGALLRSIVKSHIYTEYETGQIESEKEFSEILGKQLGIDGPDIRTALQTARTSLQANTQLVDFIQELKSIGGTRVYALSNIPQNDIDYLHRQFPETMKVFDKVFASGYAGIKKPDPDFYWMVIKESQLQPEKMIFVDDKTMNVDAACALGMHGIKFNGTAALCDQLQSLMLSK